MAIDTANKRASSFLDDCGILFPPDGTIDAFDRGWLVGQYSGIAASAVVLDSTGTPDVIFKARCRTEIFKALERTEIFKARGRSEIFKARYRNDP